MIKKIGEEYLHFGAIRREFIRLQARMIRRTADCYHYCFDESGEGMIFGKGRNHALRRRLPPFRKADAWYYFRDIDSGSLYYFGEYTENAPAVSGKYLIDHGFEAAIETPRTAKIWTYSKKTD